MTVETSGEGSAEAGPDVAELLLWVGMRGFVDRRDFERRWSVARPLPRLVRDRLLELDGEYVFLTPEGDASLTERIRRSAAGDLRSVDRFLTTFEELDRDFKRLATDWQSLRAQADEDPDGVMAVVEQWIALDGRLHQELASFPAAAGLLRAQLPVLEAARRAFDDGDWERFTGVGEDSYHSAWYAMHEVLLRATGRERTG